MSIFKSLSTLNAFLFWRRDRQNVTFRRNFQVLHEVAPHFQIIIHHDTHQPPCPHITTTGLLLYFLSPSTMFPRCISRSVLNCGSRCVVGRQRAKAATASRGLSSAFQPTSGARKSAAVEHLDDWENDTPPASKINPACIVNSHTEWDPLEEVIVGRVDDATIPEWHVSGKAVWPAKHWGMFKNQAGESFPKDLISKGERGINPGVATRVSKTP